MTFNPTQSGDFHVLVKIELDGTTLYYADENLSMSDGNYYDGRLSVSTLQRAFSSFTAPKQRQSTLTVTLADQDYTIRGMLDSYTWGNRRVRVYVGRGRDLADYILDFHGIIKIPGGISFDRDKVEIRLRDARNRDSHDVPDSKYWKSDYPNLAPEAEGMPIPIAYGDFSSTWVSATCIDTTTKRFKICNHPIKSIVGVAVNGTVASWTDANLTSAEFTVLSCDPTTDEVAVTFKGRVNGSGDLHENPIDVLYDILLCYAGVPLSDIDTAAFDAMKGDLYTMRCRRLIAEDTPSDQLIEELAIECLFDVHILNDKYTVTSRTPNLQIGRTFDEINIMEGSLRVEWDPESLYANRIKCTFDYNPMTEKYMQYIEEDATAEQLRVGQVIARTITFKWLYQVSDIQSTAQHLILLYSKEIGVIKFTAFGEGMLTNLSDRIGLTYGPFTDRPLVIREVARHYGTMTCTVYAYDEIKHVLPAYWTGDDAPDYVTATDDERATMGFWTDENCEAQPGNENSRLSHWW